MDSTVKCIKLIKYHHTSPVAKHNVCDLGRRSRSKKFQTVSPHQLPTHEDPTPEPRQKVVNRGGLRLCRGGLTFKFDKTSTDL